MAQQGNFVMAFNARKNNTQSWIIDSGASDHMTWDIIVFNNYTPCYNNSTIRIADGIVSKVVGTGSVTLTKDITLKSVLFVPKLECNLISISKITRDLNCVTKFLSNLCVFQVLDSEKTIGSAELCAGLYLLKADAPENKVQKGSFVAYILDKNNCSAEMLWHYRLGHPNFMYLRKLFPTLINKNKKFPNCEVCQLSKHTRNSFPAHKYKPTQPFSMVHSDVWGPSRVKNITGSRWFVTFIDDHTRITWLFLIKEKSKVG